MLGRGDMDVPWYIRTTFDDKGRLIACYRDQLSGGLVVTSQEHCLYLYPIGTI